MDLHIVTHGAIDVPRGTCVGQQDVDLSSGGFTAIQSLAATWRGAPPRFLFASDLRRAAQSAQVFGAQFAIEPLLDARLRALDFGDWQGRAWADIAREDPRAHRAWRDNPVIQPAPGGESFIDLLRRTSAWLASLLSSTRRGDSVLAVVHGSTVRALLCHALGLAPARSRAIATRPAAATLVRCRDPGFEVCYLHATSFQNVQDSRHD